MPFYYLAILLSDFFSLKKRMTIKSFQCQIIINNNTFIRFDIVKEFGKFLIHELYRGR